MSNDEVGEDIVKVIKDHDSLEVFQNGKKIIGRDANFAPHEGWKNQNAIVRVKRRISEEPADTLLISCKRVRPDETSVADKGTASSDVQSVFRFAGTVDSKDSQVTRHVHQAIKREKLSREQKLHSVDVVKKARDSKKAAVKRNRLKVISSRRAIDINSLVGSEAELNSSELDQEPSDSSTEQKLDSISTDCGETKNQIAGNDSSLFFLCDVEKEGENADSNPVEAASNSPPDTITCNNVPMVRKKVQEKSSSDKYVYDLYYMNSAKFDFRALENILAIEACHEEDLYVKDIRNEEEEMYEDDDDSNDEDNWRNDYPDEDPGYFCDEQEDGICFDPEEGDDGDPSHTAHYTDDYGMSDLVGRRLKICDDDDDDYLSSDEEDFAYFNQPLGGASSYNSYMQRVQKEMEEDEDDLT